MRIEEVKSKKFESNLGLENNSQDDTRILATANIQSLTSNADRLSLSTLVPNNTVNSYYAITYRQDLNSNGLQLEAAANHYNNTDINKIYSGSSPLTISEEKNRNRFRLGINYPFLLFRSSSWWGGASLQHLNEDSHFVISSDSTSTTEVDKLLRYSAVEINSNWLKKTGEQTYQVHGRIKQGLELGNEKNESTRSGTTTQGTESLNFTLINLDALWKVRLSPKWQVQTKTNIFWSDDQLPSAESVRYGGRHFGRGYPGAQAQGDKGYAAEIELRYLIPSDSVIIKRIEPYLVLDTAHSESNAMGIQHQLSSVALGLDLTDIQYYRVGFEYAQPTGDPTQNSNDHEPTYNLNLRWQF
ncbi:ShlB/FhaC/HecB family hemolysin secretion/activation protein [Marinobacterium aestuarii]|uniref:ShlB/FhaC/HecB family hemolysin secretion/activation protein n=1 Tax=Marinobacterium aestuarii TaxID=1821621 RepID=UPI001D1099A5|nr:ShlB/FhaC/HecB family hemolysin secretion/activation protein [Marinobacterium aestuarii]